jgi:hypothetical protein
MVVGLVYAFFYWIDYSGKSQISDRTFYSYLGIAAFVVLTVGLLIGAIPAIFIGRRSKQKRQEFDSTTHMPGGKKF